MERTKIEQLFENYSFWRHLSEEEKKMLQDFGMSEKKLKADLQQTALAPDGWYQMGAKAKYHKCYLLHQVP